MSMVGVEPTLEGFLVLCLCQLGYTLVTENNRIELSPPLEGGAVFKTACTPCALLSRKDREGFEPSVEVISPHTTFPM